MKIIAHRGASAELPENTMPAFARALEVGADMIELDLCASREGVLYVAHDPVRDPQGRFARAGPPAWSHVRSLAGRDGRYPALADVLDAFLGRIALNLEVKERRVVPLLVAELSRRGRRDGLLLSSFDRRAAREIRELGPELDLGFLARRLPFRLGAALAGLGARSIHVHRSSVSGRLVRLARRIELPVYVWTVDDPVELRRLQALGVDGVFTNDPRRAREVLGPAR